MSSIYTTTAAQSITNPVLYPKAKAQATTAAAGTTSAGSTSNSGQLSVTSLGSTFLKLLTQELQNQDPTAPVDSTQMVGQMISLNQLDQLAGINQTLTNQFPAAAAGTTSTASTASGSNPTAGMSSAGGSATHNLVMAGATQASLNASVQAALQALNTVPSAANPNAPVSLPIF